MSIEFTPEAIKEFQTIAREDYGKEFTAGEAVAIGKRLLLLWQLIHRPLKSKQRSTPLSPPQLSSDDPAQAAL